MISGSWVRLRPAGMMLIGQASGSDDEAWPSKISVFMLSRAVCESRGEYKASVL